MKFQSYKLSKQQYQYDNWVNVKKKKKTLRQTLQIKWIGKVIPNLINN
jgi:hypothetical protein